MAWNPFGVMLELSASGNNVVRKSATQFTVNINASWKTYYNGAQTNYGMLASSGGGSVNLNTFGNKSSGKSGSFTGTYSISGNGSSKKTITVTFKNYNDDNGSSATKTVSFNVNVPAWTSYTVKYNANGGSGAPSTQTKWKDQTLKLSATKPTRNGYVFQGWSTSAGGSVEYVSGANYTSNSSITLYAVWKAITYTIKYNANGGYNAPSSQTKTYGSALTLSSAIPKRSSVEDNGSITEYSFKGWSTSASSTSVAYKAGSSYTANASATLYAVWSKTTSVNSYSVSYNTNGGSDVVSQTKIKGTALKIRNTIPIKTGYTFVGWGLSADSTTAAYTAGDNYTTDEDVVLYAIWTPWTHTVVFDANGGTGDMPESFVKTTGVDVLIPNSNISKKNHVFKYWSTQPSGSGGTNYYSGDGYFEIRNGGTITLYAIWDITTIYMNSNGICKAGEFIESDNCGFYNDGTLHYREFVEGKQTIGFDSNSFYANELMERIVVYLTDKSGNKFTDENGRRFTTII